MSNYREEVAKSFREGPTDGAKLANTLKGLLSDDKKDKDKEAKTRERKIEQRKKQPYQSPFSRD